MFMSKCQIFLTCREQWWQLSASLYSLSAWRLLRCRRRTRTTFETRSKSDRSRRCRITGRITDRRATETFPDTEEVQIRLKKSWKWVLIFRKFWGKIVLHWNFGNFKDFLSPKIVVAQVVERWLSVWAGRIWIPEAPGFESWLFWFRCFQSILAGRQ